MTENALMQVRRDTYRHLLTLPMAFFATRRVGELSSRISADVALLQDTFTTTLAELVRQTIIIAVGLVLLTALSPASRSPCWPWCPWWPSWAWSSASSSASSAAKVQDRIADTNVVVDETLQAIQSVKAFANEAWEALRYDRSVTAARDLALKGARWRGAFVSFIILCLFGGMVLVIWRGVLLKEEGVLSTGELVTFIMYSVFIGASIGSIPELVTTILKGIGATERLMDIRTRPGSTSWWTGPGAASAEGRIAFDRVSFHYASRPDVPVLRQVSFAAEPGGAWPGGPQRCGKSTIASLVLRFYDPMQGVIRIDDRPAGDYPLSALRDRMAIVPQEVLLFGGSIRENIAYGRPGAPPMRRSSSRPEGQRRRLHRSLPGGLCHAGGRTGVQLSGGQRQRIAIARAILKDPAILILDEATSALDTESERQVQEALDA